MHAMSQQTGAVLPLMRLALIFGSQLVGHVNKAHPLLQHVATEAPTT